MAAKLRKLNIGSIGLTPGGVLPPTKPPGEPESTKEDAEEEAVDICRKWDLRAGSGRREGNCRGNDSWLVPDGERASRLFDPVAQEWSLMAIGLDAVRSTPLPFAENAPSSLGTDEATL